jgi:PAS domain S-box-containing protein
MGFIVVNINSDEEVSQSSEILSTIFDLSPDAIALTRVSDGKFIDCNQEYLNQIGYSKEEVIGHTSKQLNLYADENRQEYVDQILRKKTVTNFEIKVRRKDAIFINVLYSGRIIDLNNEKILLNIGKDITELKKEELVKQELLENEKQLTEELTVSNEELQSTSEELQVTNEELMHQGDELLKINKALEMSEKRYRNILDNIQDAYLRADKEGNIIIASPSAARMYNYDSPQDMIGVKALSFYKNPEDRTYVLVELKKHGKVENNEVEALRNDDTSFFASQNAQFYYDENGQVLGTETLVRDITKRKERENLSDALNQINVNINSKLDYDDIMQSIVDLGTKAIGAESSVINLREENGWIVKFVYNFPNNIIGQIKSDEESPTSIYVANKKEAVAFNDAPNDSRVNRNGMKLHGVASLLVVPVILKDEVRGIIAFYHHKKSVVFTDAQIDFANKLASSVSQALENAELFENIKKSEEKYHSLYSSMNEGVALHEIIYNTQHEAVDYVVTDINQAYEKITGLKLSDVQGKKASELYGTGNPPYVKIYADVAENGKPTEFETFFEPMDKYFRISVISPDKGKFATIFDDITERKKAEHELKESEEKYRNIVEIANEGIMIADTSGRINFVNAKMAEMLGYSSEELIGTDATTLVDKNEIEIGLQKIENRKKGIQESYEIKYIRKSGEELWCLISATPMYDYNGKHIGNMTMQTDITERKKANDALQESEERYHSLFDNNHAVMLLINPDNGDIIDANPAATHFYGYNYDELVKMNINNINVLSEEEIHDKMQKSVSSQQNNFLFKHKLASGKIRDVDVYSGTIVLGGKKLLYSIVHDVTDRVIAQNKLNEYNEQLQSTTEELQVTNEELHQQEDKLLQTYNELKESEERFRSIIENIQDAYMRTDKEGTIIMASPSAARMYRFNSTQEMIGTSTPSYFKNSEDRDYAIEKLKKHGKFNDYEVEARRNDGTFFWVSQNAQYYYDDQGKIQGRETIERDITMKKEIEAALKKSESNLAEAQQIAHIGSWEWNLKTGDINWSNELYSIYGVDPNTFTPTLSSFADYMHPDDEEYVNKHVDQLLSDNKSHNFDFRIVLDDGTIRVLNTIAEVAEFDKNGKPSIIVGINQDITDRKEIELKLNENIKKLAQSNKELEQFAYITSHDLREPLRMITSFLQLLERRYQDKLDQDANEFIGFAVDGAKRLDAMTNDLLQYSRITNEKRELTLLNFEEVLEEALINLKIPIEENNAVITHDPLPSINADKQLKVQLFQNLISNSIKYRSPKTPKIHISVKKEKNYFLFSFKDNGIGMSQEHLKKIFTIFQRLHTNEEYEGTGIGLAIAQKIVHQQGGQIWVESEPNKGSTFYFTIPTT